MSEASESVGGYKMPTCLDDASDEFKARLPARAQQVWAGLGGLGPVPARMVGWGEEWWFYLATEHPTALATAKAAAESGRHAYRLRLIEATLTGLSLTIDDDVAARSAILRADAVLARLDAEARGGK